MLLTIGKDIWNVIKFLLQNIIIVNCILSVVIIFFQRKNPTAVWTWLLVLYFLPIFGFFLYLMIGGDVIKRRMFHTKEIEDQMHKAIQGQEEDSDFYLMLWKNVDFSTYRSQIFYNWDSAGALLTSNNGLTTFFDGNDKYNRLIQDMEQAKESIHMEYYIIKDDELFSRICQTLEKKAAEGVEVRILADGMGGRFVKDRRWRTLRKAGIKTAIFFPAILKRFQLRLNYRNHRKIVVIDGRIGYVGGFNVGREYIDLSERFGHWRDTHLRIDGDAAKALQLRFLLDWNYAAKESLIANRKYFPILSDQIGCRNIQVISSGPDSNLQHIRNNYLRLISGARKRIYIQTPYFIPDESVYNALIVAARSGVEVNLMIPCKPDHPFVYWATNSYMGDLIMAGAKCYTYQNGFLHAKGVIVDEEVYCYGTANMDIRSFKLNFEVNAVVYDKEEAKRMTEQFMEDTRHSKLITKDMYMSRPYRQRVKERVSRLLSPLL